VTSVYERETGGQRAIVLVERNLKGLAGVSETEIEILQPVQSGIRLELGQTALLFLDGPELGLYTMAGPAIRVPRAPAAMATPGDLWASLETELIAALASNDREVRRVAIEQLGNLGRIQYPGPLRIIAASAEAELAWLARAALIRLGDLDTLAALAIAPEQSAPEPGAAAVPAAVRELRAPEMAEVLRTLADSPWLDLRTEVFYALRSMGDAGSMDVFIAGLDDNDEAVRYHSAVALAELTKMEPVLSLSAFRERQERVVRNWKIWWQREGRIKFGAAKQ
jgi:HEAT repeat protein